MLALFRSHSEFLGQNDQKVPKKRANSCKMRVSSGFHGGLHRSSRHGCFLTDICSATTTTKKCNAMVFQVAPRAMPHYGTIAVATAAIDYRGRNTAATGEEELAPHERGWVAVMVGCGRKSLVGGACKGNSWTFTSCSQGARKATISAAIAAATAAMLKCDTATPE